MESVLSIIAIVISAASIGISLYIFFWTARRDRKQATLEAYNRLQAEVFDPLNLYMPAVIRDISKDRKSEQYKIISGYLARIEHFCVGVNHNIYDKNVFYALAHGYFDRNQLRKRIEPLILAKNQGNDTTELFYNDTLAVLNWMDKMAEKNEHKTS